MRLLITGATGNLGRFLVRAGKAAGHQVIPWGSARGGEVDGQPVVPVDLANPDAVAEHFWRSQPMAVIHSGAISSIAECHRDPVRAFKINVEATRQLVGLCMVGIARLVFVSTDLVFDGERGGYTEHEKTHPLSMYGKTKVDAERAVLLYRGHLVARLSLLVGPGPAHRPNYFDRQVAALRRGEPVTLFVDELRSPLATGSAAEALVKLAGVDYGGVLHVGGPERLSRYEMGLELARVLGVDPALVRPQNQAEVKAPEPRPRDVSLDSTRLTKLWPDLFLPGFAEAARQAVVAAT